MAIQVKTADQEQSARGFGFVVICVAAACTMTMNAYFGYKSATVLMECLLLAVLSIVVDLIRFLGLPQIFHHFERGAWVKGLLSSFLWTVTVGYCFLSAFGFAVMTKETTVTVKNSGSEKYNEAILKKKNATDALSFAKATQRWTATSACTDATLDESKEFCKQVKFRQKEIEEADKTIVDMGGPPKPVDAQASQIAKYVGMSETQVRFAIAIFFAFTAELITSVGPLMYSRSRRAPGSIKKKRKYTRRMNVTPMKRKYTKRVTA